MKILANGEIVADDDPRVQRRLSQVIPFQSRQRDDVTTDSHPPMAPTIYVFDSINQRLTSIGVPTWNIGPYPVSPVMSAGLVLSFVALGFRGLLFSGILFFIISYSRGSDNSLMNQSPFGATRVAGSMASQATNMLNQVRAQNDNLHQNQPTSSSKDNAKYFTGPGHKLT